MPFSLLLRSLVPVLLLLPQAPTIAAVPSLPVTVIAQTPAALKKEITELKQELDKQQKKIEDQQKYNSDLMNTVFFSLLGSVLTVTAGVLAVKIYADAIERQYQKKELIAEAKSDIRYYLDKKLNALEVRVGWLEYQIATLAANQSERDEGISGLVAIQDRLRAIQALCRLNRNDQKGIALKPIRSEIVAIKLSLESFLKLEVPSLLEREQKTELNRFAEKIKKNSISFFNSLGDDELKNVGIDSSYSQTIKEDIEVIKELMSNLVLISKL